MNFTLNEEQQMLADTVGRFVAAEYDFEARRKRLAAAQARRASAKRCGAQLAEMGLFGLNVPEAHGGIGGGPVETHDRDGSAGPRPGARALPRAPA